MQHPHFVNLFPSCRFSFSLLLLFVSFFCLPILLVRKLAYLCMLCSTLYIYHYDHSFSEIIPDARDEKNKISISPKSFFINSQRSRSCLVQGEVVGAACEQAKTPHWLKQLFSPFSFSVCINVLIRWISYENNELKEKISKQKGALGWSYWWPNRRREVVSIE